MQWTAHLLFLPPQPPRPIRAQLTLSLQVGRHMRCVAKYTVCSLYAAMMLNANFLHKFQLLVHSKAKLSFKDEHFWSLSYLFETAFG